jgi:hypothetical protein
MKLFTKDIDRHLFKQYHLGSDLENQVVVAKIFNPYQNMRWFLINSDVDDPDYIWAIVQMGNNVEVGSVSRSELETIRISPFRLPLERDLGFIPVNAQELLNGLRQGKFYKKGGFVDNENKEMVENQATEVKHHSEELSNALKNTDHVDAWVVGKMERATTDLSDVTHYLDGESKKMADGGEVSREVWVIIEDGKFAQNFYQLFLNEYQAEDKVRYFVKNKYIKDKSQVSIKKIMISESDYQKYREINKILSSLKGKGVLWRKSSGRVMKVSNKEEEKRELLNNVLKEKMADGGEVDSLKGKVVRYDLLGGGSGMFVVDDVMVSPPYYSKREVSLYTKEGGIDKFPYERLSDFMSGKSVEVRDSKGEPYTLTLKNRMADGGMMADGNYVKIKNYPTFETEEQAKKFIKIGKPILRKEVREGKVVLVNNGKEFFLANVKGGMMAKGGGVDNYKHFELNAEGNFASELNGKNYEVIYRDDKSQMYDLFENGKKIKSSKYVREVMTFADGGKIKDQYKGRTPEDIWNNFSKQQRSHFIYDHEKEIEIYRGEEYGELSGKEIIKAYNSEYKELDKNIKNRFDNHTREGQYADGGEVNKYAEVFDKLKKGDKVKITFGSSISKQNKAELLVKSKNIVGKGKSYESEKITFENTRNPQGIKFYAYKRKSGYVGFAMGDLAISDVQISFEEKMADGGETSGMETINYLKGVSGLRASYLSEWAEKNNVDLVQVAKAVKTKKLKPIDLSTAVSGKDGNKYAKEIITKYSKNKMSDGGMSNKKTTFDDKVKAIQSSLLKRKKVSPKVQKDYGKTYNKKEALQSAKRIVGAMRKKGK